MSDGLVAAPPDYRSQSSRLMTFTNIHEEEQFPVPAASLASAGFIRTGTQQVKCAFCKLELKNFHSSHIPLAWHRTYSRNCVFLRDNNTVNIKDLDIAFPDVGSSTVVLNQVLPSSRPRDQTYADIDPDDDLDHDFITPTNDAGHLTIQNLAGDTADGAEELPNNPDELNRIYQGNSQLRYILHKTQVDLLKKEQHREVQGLNTASYNYEYQRRVTFTHWPMKDVVSPKSLAASGFTYTGSRDVVECVYCKVRIQGWTSDMIPDAVHQQKSPACHLIQGLNTITNIPDVMSDLFEDENTRRPSADRQISMDLGIITDTTKHPHLAVESRRETSFLTWPRINKKLASEMIEHKLFYTGNGDTVCCFSCGAEMSKWTSIENIWIRHARQSPKCQLLLREKGQDFITSTIEQHGRYVEPAKEPTINVVTTRMLRPRMDSPVAQAVIQMVDPDYRREDVRSALIQNIKYGGSDFMFTSDLVRAILDKKADEQDLNRVRRSIEDEPPPPVVVTSPQPQATAEVEPVEEVEGHGPSPSLHSAETQDISMAATGGAESMVTSTLGSEPSTSGMQREQRATSPPAGDPLEIARTMKAQLTCKICMDATVGIAFLPCGHMVCCPSCAPAMTQCPLCRQEVKGTVRAYLDKL